MPKFTISISVSCAVCGKKVETDADWIQGDYVLTVDPCETCLTKAHDKGYEEGTSTP